MKGETEWPKRSKHPLNHYARENTKKYGLNGYFFYYFSCCTLDDVSENVYIKHIEPTYDFHQKL